VSFGVSGQRLEAEIGLYFYNARFYDATLGRFAQADTIIPGAGNAHEFTHMVQASGDPHGNFSVASELEARIVEYYIKVELGHELSTSDKKIFELYDKNPDISKEDLKQFRNDYLLNGNLWWPENLGTSLAWMVYRFEPLTQGVGDFVLIQTFKLMGAHFSAESTAPAVPTGRKNMDIYIR